LIETVFAKKKERVLMHVGATLDRSSVVFIANATVFERV